MKTSYTFIQANNTLDCVTGVTISNIVNIVITNILIHFYKFSIKFEDLTLVHIFNIGNKTYASFRDGWVNRSFLITQNDEQRRSNN